MTATGREPTTTKFINKHWTILQSWPNLAKLHGCVFVFELSGYGFESSCSHLSFRFPTCFEQGGPWHSGNYRMRIHSEKLMWHYKNIQSYIFIYKYTFSTRCYNVNCLFNAKIMQLILIILHQKDHLVSRCYFNKSYALQNICIIKLKQMFKTNIDKSTLK